MTIQVENITEVYVTPPAVSAACSPTPPPTNEKTRSAVLRVLEDIQSREATYSCRVRNSRELDPWTAYSLDTEDYQELLELIQRDEALTAFIDNKLKFDYFPSTQRLVLRMPTDVHENFLTFVVEEINTQLKTFVGPSGDFAQQIRSRGSSTIKFENPTPGRHDPDGQFRHRNAQFSGVVIEVSYSQDKKDLPRLADDYILGSDASINMMVGLDIEYSVGGVGAGMATWSLWEPEIVRDDEEEEDVLITKLTVDSEVFRTPTCSVPTSLPNHDLQIPLHAFAPPSCYPSNVPPTGSIIIPAKTLHEFLVEAERMASMTVQQTGNVALKTWGKKRKMEKVLPEELLERDEKRWKHEEDMIEEKGTEDDSSYQDSAGSNGN